MAHHTSSGVALQFSIAGDVMRVLLNHLVEPQFVAVRLHIQRVNDLHVDRTKSSLVYRMVGNRVVGVTEAAGGVVGHLHITVFVKQDAIDGLIAKFKFIAAVTHANQTGHCRAVAIGGSQHRAVDGLMRDSGVALDVLSAFEVGLLLALEASDVLLAVGQIVIIGVSHCHIIIGLMVHQVRVVARGELIFSDYEAMGDTCITAIDLQLRHIGLQ